MEQKKVLAICKSEEDPSAYYRIIQYVQGHEHVRYVSLFSNKAYRRYYGGKRTIFEKVLTGIRVECKAIFILLWDRVYYRSDVLIINRKIFPKYCPRLVRAMLQIYFQKKYVIWDFDDNIFQNGEISNIEWQLYENTADKVIVTNEFLKGMLSARLQAKTDLLPTTDRDFEDIQAQKCTHKRRALFSTKLNLIWTGTGGNLVFLEQITEQLEQAAKDMRDREVTLYVVCNLPLRIRKKYCYLKIKNIKWTRKGARRLLESMHIGLMPLNENAFTKGKGAFKAVQYIGAGLPVVASPVGFNCVVVQDGKNGFLTEDRWAESIQKLAQSFEQWETYSQCARKHWEQTFNSKKNLEYWEDLLLRP